MKYLLLLALLLSGCSKPTVASCVKEVGEALQTPEAQDALQLPKEEINPDLKKEIAEICVLADLDTRHALQIIYELRFSH